MPTAKADGLAKTSLAFPRDLLDRLERIARDRQVAMSVIVREAIKEKLDRMEHGGPVLDGRVA